MKLHNAKAVYAQANILYGTVIDSTNFEDILISGWELIGNRQTRLYKYTAPTDDKKLKLPCNVDLIEAVFLPMIDAQVTHPYSMYPDIYNQWTEQYIESWKRNKNIFYDKGVLAKYRRDGDDLVFDRDYQAVTVLYHGVVMDEDGLPLLNDKEVQALASYFAYMDMYKKSLTQRNGALFQLASAIKLDWLRLCNSARVPMHISQNDMNDILDAKVRADRKTYGKSFKAML